MFVQLIVPNAAGRPMLATERRTVRRVALLAGLSLSGLGGLGLAAFPLLFRWSFLGDAGALWLAAALVVLMAAGAILTVFSFVPER